LLRARYLTKGASWLGWPWFWRAHVLCSERQYPPLAGSR